MIIRVLGQQMKKMMSLGERISTSKEEYLLLVDDEIKSTVMSGDVIKSIIPSDNKRKQFYFVLFT